MAQHDQPITSIPEICPPLGDTIFSLPNILEAFHQFYQTLYTFQLTTDFQPADLAAWLDPLALDWLSDIKREAVVHPIMPEEVLLAICSFFTGKSPGLDGLLIKFYKAHGDLLAPFLASLYSNCLTEGALLDSMSHAHIVLIYKPPKDPSSCASYRPIALLNAGFKILTKLITQRL